MSDTVEAAISNDVVDTLRDRLQQLRRSIRWDAQQRENSLTSLSRATQNLDRAQAAERQILQHMAEKGWLTDEDLKPSADDEGAPF